MANFRCENCGSSLKKDEQRKVSKTKAEFCFTGNLFKLEISPVKSNDQNFEPSATKTWNIEAVRDILKQEFRILDQLTNNLYYLR